MTNEQNPNIIEEPSNDHPFMSILDKLGLDLNHWDRPVTQEELIYLYEQFPFIQLTTSGKRIPSYDPPKIVQSQSGWNILNFGDALTSSPGRYLFNYAGYPQFVDGGGDPDDEGGTGVGTLTGQTYITAGDMIDQAIKNGWKAIHIVDGNPDMIWAVWNQAQDKELAVSGFDPSRKDNNRRERVKRSDLADQLAKKGIRNKSNY